jgi:hypothetical protein
MAMLKLLGTLAVVLAAQVSSSAAPQPTDASIERMRAALAAQALVLSEVTRPTVKLWGGLSLVPPDQVQGQAVQIKIPVGDLVVKATGSAAVALRERTERKAHEEVTKALQAFQRSQR